MNLSQNYWIGRWNLIQNFFCLLLGLMWNYKFTNVNLLSLNSSAMNKFVINKDCTIKYLQKFAQTLYKCFENKNYFKNSKILIAHNSLNSSWLKMIFNFLKCRLEIFTTNLNCLNVKCNSLMPHFSFNLYTNVKGLLKNKSENVYKTKNNWLKWIKIN